MAIELDPGYIGAHEYLGELYLMLNNEKKAKEMLVKLKSLAEPNSEEYKDLKYAIDQY